MQKNRDLEQQILAEFLSERLPEIRGEVEKEINGFSLDTEGLKPKVLDLKVKQMKAAKTPAGLSVFQDALLGQAEGLVDSSERELLRNYRETGVKADMPKVVATLKKAEELVLASIEEEIGEKDILAFAIEVEEANRAKEIRKDLFYGINHGLDPSQVEQYMTAMYSLRKRQTAKPTNVGLLKENVLHAIQDGEITLVHLKCPRYTYPHGNRLQIVGDLESREVPTKEGGIYHSFGEHAIVRKLEDIKRVFEDSGIKPKLKVLVMDQGLEDQFPDGTGLGYVPDEDIKESREAIRQYKDNLERAIGSMGEVKLLGEYLSEKERTADFQNARLSNFQSIRREEGHLPVKFVEQRVNYFTDSFAQKLTAKSTRQFARNFVYADLATTQALGVLKETEKELVLVEEDRGSENNFIGGIRENALPVYFTKLKDYILDDEPDIQ